MGYLEIICAILRNTEIGKTKYKNKEVDKALMSLQTSDKVDQKIKDYCLDVYMSFPDYF